MSEEERIAEKVDNPGHGVPGAINMRIECGDGSNYDVVVAVDPNDLSDMTIWLEQHDSEAAEDRILFTPKTWKVVRDAVDSAIRISEQSRDALKDERARTRAFRNEKPPADEAEG